jgi:hypothetical protein
MENTENIYNEAIWGMLSEIKKQMGTLLTNSIKNQSPVTGIETANLISKQELKEIVRDYSNQLAKYIHKESESEIQTIKYIESKIDGLNSLLQNQSQSKTLSLEDIAGLFPKAKKVTICSFKFLQTSVIIFALVLISFLSLALNIKQMDDYQALKAKYYQQTEYIYQLQEVEKEDSDKSK